MTMTHTQVKSTNISQRPGLTSVSEVVLSPQKKKSDETGVPCTLGKVCNWNTVDDNVQSHDSKKERRMHKLLLGEVHLYSDDMGIL